MSDLTDFLLARIAEDEAAGGSMREMPRGDTGWGEVLFDHGTGRIWATSVRPHREITEQYNAWVKTLPLSKSARRVLAECVAKRKIIAFHENWPVLIQTEPSLEITPETWVAKMTSEIAWRTNAEYVKRFGTDPPTAPMLLAMAQVYADHPDFREEWRA